MSKFHFGILASLFAERVPKDLRIKIKEGDENKKNIKKVMYGFSWYGCLKCLEKYQLDVWFCACYI